MQAPASERSGSRLRDATRTMPSPAKGTRSVSDAQNIEALLSELRVFEPPEGFRADAVADDPAIYDTANADYEAFWAAQAEDAHVGAPVGHRDELEPAVGDLVRRGHA